VTSRARNIRLQVLTTAFAGPRGPAPNLVRGDAAATKGNLTERQCQFVFSAEQVVNAVLGATII